MLALKVKMINKRTKSGIVILAVVALIVAGFAAIIYLQPKKEAPDEEPIKELDDRVSPLTTQAVFFQINRIRHKGVIDQVMNSGIGMRILNSLPIRNQIIYRAIESFIPGIGWNKKPRFSYMFSLDGYEYRGRIDFITWDTGYINQEFYRLVQEEQQTTTVEFKFLVIEKKLLKTTERVVESFSLEYDFKTGRWTGDDYFNDSDGYGHYDGSNFEMWFKVRQTDKDADGIPYWTEVNVLGTDPALDDTVLDPDEDGIPTAWEWKWGYNHTKWDNHSYLDPDNDGLQNDEEWYMEKWLADPFRPEIYLEADWLDRAPFRPYAIEMRPGKILKFINRPTIVETRLDGWEHTFYEETQQMLMDRFNEHGITMHIDDGCMGGGGEILPFGTSGEVINDRAYGQGAYHQDKGLVSEYYHNNFADDRKGIFRYLVIAHGGGWCHAQDFKGYYDCLTVPMNKIFFKNIYALKIVTNRMKRIGQAIEILHELGHSCGFNLTYHGGVDNNTADALKTWGNYRSCMAYLTWWEKLFDYSDGSHGEGDKDDWGNIDLAYFQRTSEELEGLGFDASGPPYNR